MMKAKKRYGQHFLQPEWSHKLIEAIAPKQDEKFLEIGPGPGALTLRLAQLAAHVTAIEVDREMVAALRPRLPDNVNLVEADVLETDLVALATSPMRVAGNLPYNVSSPILFRLLAARRAGAAFTDATLMLQREVADRIVSGPGTKDYGVLSILVQLHADVRMVLTLPPGAFRPAPKVHSAVVRLAFGPPAVQLTDEALFETMVRSMFTQRRKTLSNALKPFAEAREATAAAALGDAGIDSRRRPETLQLDELARLAEFFAAATR